MIPAHDSNLAAIAFNPTGTKMATASERGTVIRIFSVQDGTRLMEFRRGVKRCAHVYSLAFSQDSDYLALSSNTETIHIFRLDQQPTEMPAVEHRQQQQQSPAAGQVQVRSGFSDLHQEIFIRMMGHGWDTSARLSRPVRATYQHK